MKKFTVNPVFKNLLPPLSSDELENLTKQIREDGVQTPVVVWKEFDIIVDGHHRVEIAEQLGIDYPVKRKSFPDEDSVARYIIETQGARRNISKFDLERRIGAYYESVKQNHGGQERGSGQNDHSIPKRTDERVAKIFKVSPKTVRRSAKFAQVVEKLSTLVPDIVERIERREYASRASVERAADEAKTYEEAISIMGSKGISESAEDRRKKRQHQGNNVKKRNPGKTFDVRLERLLSTLETIATELGETLDRKIDPVSPQFAMLRSTLLLTINTCKRVWKACGNGTRLNGATEEA
jgi:ParB-like chromosome segregation protein Spo0J